jgi:hypothetical protein
VHILVLVDVGDQRGEGRSSSAVKKADALLRIAFARRSSRTSRSNARSVLCPRSDPGLLPGINPGPLDPAPQRVPVDAEVLTDAQACGVDAGTTRLSTRSDPSRIARAVQA